MASDSQPNVLPPNLLTVISIAVCAAVGVDLVHEAIGHGIASWLVGDRILSISTVALQNAHNSRWVSAAGTAANYVVGAVCLTLVHRAKFFRAPIYFVWLFGAFNLLNCGYLVASGLFGGGDWGNVVSGLEPAALWRIVLVAGGGGLYVFGVRSVAGSILPLVKKGEVAVRDLWRLLFPAYLAAGVVMTLASLFNPISPALILVSGVAASFGLNAGLLFVPGVLDNQASPAVTDRRVLPFSTFWAMLAIAVAALFIGVLGRGIRLSR